MKRKSILMTIVALLFAGVAFGADYWFDGSGNPESTVPSPPSTTLPVDVKGVDSIYFCAVADALYPIEFGYDVAGKYLSPKYGEWSLLATTEGVTLGDYTFTGNGGAGNVFKGVGSGIGGYVFQYVATDELCGLAEGEKYYIYVFVLPNVGSEPVQKDTSVCEGSTISSFDPRDHIPYKNVYEAAGFGFNAPVPASWTIATAVAGDDDSVYVATIDLTLPDNAKNPGAYTCGGTITFNFKVTVTPKDFTLDPKKIDICSSDTAGANGLRNPAVAELFNRTVSGSYAPATVGGGTWTAYGDGRFYKWFVYTYKSCATGGGNLTVYDTLFLTPGVGGNGDWGVDTVVLCRQGSTADLYNIYSSVQGGGPALLTTNSYWKDYGVSNDSPVTNYGTIDNGTSITGIHTIDLDNMLASAGYYYKWELDAASNCFAGDSGKIVVILTDPFVASDYRVQVCNKDAEFDIAAYTGISDDAAWTSIPSTLSLSNGKITWPAGTKSTYKLEYNLSAGCGAAGGAVLYLKLTDVLTIAGSVEEIYCKTKLPASINLNELLGISNAGSWTYTSGGNVTDAWTVAGIVDCSKLLALNPINALTGANKIDFVFTFTPDPSTCITGTRTVTISVRATVL
jgi:hypothetical protein